MYDVCKELGKLISSQQEHIHRIVDELEQSEGEFYEQLDQQLDRLIVARDMYIQSLEDIINPRGTP
jgi:hypothetical protein